MVNILLREKQKIDFVKVEQAFLDVKEIALIKQKTHVVINKIERGDFYKSTQGNAENDVVVKIDITHQIGIQKQIKNEFGSYINLEFESSYKSKTENPIKHEIYLFKADFQSKKDVEVRVYLNNKKEIVNLNMISWEKEIYIY